MLLRVLPVALVAGLLAVAIVGTVEPAFLGAVIDRFAKAFDLNESSNLARLYFWQLGWDLWAAHDGVLAILLGVPDELSRVGLRGIESSVLSVGIEYGLVGMVLYAAGFARLLRNTAVTTRAMLPAYGGLVITIATVSVLKALGFGTLFWFLVLRSEWARAAQMAADPREL